MRTRRPCRIQRMSLRGQVDYRLSEGPLLRQISTSMNWDISKRLNNNLTLSKNLGNSDTFYLSNQLSLRVRDADLSFSLRSNFDGDWQVFRVEPEAGETSR